MLRSLLLVVAGVGLVGAQLDAFALPQEPRFAPKPTVPPEFRNYFELDGHAREFVDSILGPRPGGLFPEKTFEIGAPTQSESNNQPVHVPSPLERTLEQFFTAPEQPSGGDFPPGFGGGFSVANNNKPLASSNVRRAPQSLPSNEPVVEGSGEAPSKKSSISGIPDWEIKLPKAQAAIGGVDRLFHHGGPAVSNEIEPEASAPRVAEGTPSLPEMDMAPEVPEGGLLPQSDIRRAPQSVSEVAASSDDEMDEFNTEEYGGLSEDTSSSSGGLIGTILNMVGLGAKKAREAANNKTVTTTTMNPFQERNALGKAVSSLLGGENSPLPAKGMISKVLYQALTAGSLQGNDSSSELDNDTEKNHTLVLTPAQSAAITENLQMIQNLIIQPSSPFCQNKPEPVEFDIDLFMGQWYQVIYTPPLSAGPCSMVAYKKLSDVNNGGAGSIFELFEYTTDGTPYGKPKISSGYAIVKEPGELIFRSTSSTEDVTVHVLHVGPLNSKGEYEYTVMSTNCNFPVYVYARDPLVFKERYEADVNQFLSKKGLVNGFSRLLNIIAPVDNAMCTFPPSLFNIQG